MKLVSTASYTQIMIASVPVHRHCSNCAADRAFRLLAEYRFRHIGHLFRWDYEEKLHRVCAECGHAFAMSTREIQQVLPTYLPAASKYRRRLVQVVFLAPVVLYVIAWNLSKYVRQ